MSGEQVELGSGSLRVGVKSLDGMPLFALRVLLVGGATLESRPGEAWLAGRMLSEGTTTRDWQRLSLELEERGVALASAGGLESHGLALDCLADDWRWALETAAEIVWSSEFAEERCEWVKEQGAAELESLFDQPDVVAGWAFMDQLYRPHPAGRPLLGAPGQLSAVTAEDSERFHRRSVERGIVVAAAGAVDAEEVAALAQRLFGDLPGDAVLGPGEHQAPSVRQGAGSELAPPNIEGRPTRRLHVEVPADGQAHLYVGHVTLDRFHHDVPAFELLAVALGAGAGLAGRLPTRLREVEGLSYTTEVATLGGAGRAPGRFSVYCACAPERVAEAEQAIREELALVLRNGVEDDEVRTARRYLLGRQPLQRETARQWCDLLAESLFYDQPCWDLGWRQQRLDAVDADQVSAAARRHLDVDRLSTTVGEGGEGGDGP